MRTKEAILDEIVRDWSTTVTRPDAYEAMDKYSDEQFDALVKWLYKRKMECLDKKEDAADVNDTINQGAKARAFTETIDYINQHFRSNPPTIK